MSASGACLFDTPIGRCGLVWSEAAILGLCLPETTEAETRARLERRYPQAPLGPPSPLARRAMASVVELLDGGAPDLLSLPLEEEGVPDFHRRVYAIVRAIPPGRTLTYGEVAARAGEPGAAQAVGQAMGRNPYPILMPCHRVVAAGGRPGGFTAPGGLDTKARLLEREGVVLRPQGDLFG